MLLHVLGVVGFEVAIVALVDENRDRQVPVNQVR